MSKVVEPLADIYSSLLQPFHRWLSPHRPLFLWQQYSLAPSSTALLKMCTVSHPLPPHTHPALTIHPSMPHSLSMHKNLNCILPPTPL